MAHMELSLDFSLEKYRALIWVLDCDFKCEISAKAEHYFDFQKLSGAVPRPRSGQCLGCGYMKFAFPANKHKRNCPNSLRGAKNLEFVEQCSDMAQIATLIYVPRV